MLLVKKNIKQGFVCLRITLADDLWYLSHLIEAGDFITAKSERKIKLDTGENTRSSVTRKIITLQICVESVDLEQGAVLRVKGLVSQGTDDVPSGVYHSFSFQLGDELTLNKSVWPSFLLKKLADALNNTAQNILVCLFDRSSALFALVSQQGITYLSELEGEVQNKQYETKSDSSIIAELVSQTLMIQKQHRVSAIVFGSPGFWHTPLQHALSDDLKKIASIVTAHRVDKASVAAILSRPELQSLLSNQRVAIEQKLVDVMLEKLSKQKLSYGIRAVADAVNQGSVESIVVTDTFLSAAKQNNTYDYVDSLLKLVDAARGEVHILFSDETKKPIDGLGGIVASLRWVAL